jgi:hypothetical protein
MTKEEVIRKKVRALRGFYIDCINFVIFNLILILLWWSLDKSGSFWPKYVIVGWGVWLILKAFRKGIIPLIFHKTSFFNGDWEEKKVKEIMRRHGIPQKTRVVRKENKK